MTGKEGRKKSGDKREREGADLDTRITIRLTPVRSRSTPQHENYTLREERQNKKGGRKKERVREKGEQTTTPEFSRDSESNSKSKSKSKGE